MKESPDMTWNCESSQPGPDILLFRVRYDLMRNPRNGESLTALVLQSGDWVNVAALTPEGKILVVRQFRFGVRRTSTELPAGLVEPGENPADAAKRELQEETGYTSDEWVSLGSVDGNSAFLNNQCHLWLARNAVKSASTNFDPGEDIQMDELSLDEIKQEIKAGHITNSLSLLTLYKLFDLRETL